MKRPLCMTCALYLIIQAAGMGILSRTEKAQSPEMSGKESASSDRTEQVLLTGTVDRIEEKEKVTAVFLKNNQISASDQKISESKVLVYIKPDQMKIRNQNQIKNHKETRIKAGNRLRISGEAEVFSSARNPGNFDQKFYYEKQGIRRLIRAEQVEIISGETDKIKDFLQRMRTGWKEKLIRHLGDYYGNTMSAVLLGEKAGLDEEMKKMYQKNGIGHILAISGLHMSFIGSGLYSLLRKTGLPFAAAGICGGLILIFYTIMIGGSVSAVRALIMFLIRAGADVWGRDYDLLTSLLVSAAGVCIWQPLYLLDAAFQLSYGAILGIALMAPVFGDMLRCSETGRRKDFKKDEKNRNSAARGIGRCIAGLPGKLAAGLSSSLAVSVFLMGPLLYFYFEIPPYSALLNLFIIPAMSLVMGAGLFGSLLTLVSDYLGGLVLQACRAVLIFYDGSCSLAGKLPGSRFVTGQPGALWLAVYYGAVAAAYLVYRYLIFRKKKREAENADGRSRIEEPGLLRTPGIFLLGFAAVMLFVCRAGHEHQGGVQVTVLDVGQGDGIFIRSPSGNAYFVDGGSSDVSSSGTYRIEPFLLAEGVDTLEYVFLSHGDSDHLNGMTEMLANQEMGVRIRTLVLPPAPFHDKNLLQAARTAAENGTRITVMNPGNKISEILPDGVFALTCLAPEESLAAEEGSNASSMVLELTYGKFSMLFTGDLEGAGEKALAESGRLKEYTVLKAAHHGSRSSGSEDFLHIINPSAAIISAGQGNRYGHPHPETLERLQEAGCTVYSTRDYGAVSVWTDGSRVKIGGFIRPGSINR